MSSYTTLATAKNRLGISDTTDDDALSSVIAAASRWVDRHCGRRFHAVTETRYYTAHSGRLCLIDEAQSVSAVATDDDDDRTYGTNWAATDYELWPPNAVLDGSAYTEIHVTPEGDYAFPLSLRGVKVTGSFGETPTGEHPPEIEEATLLLAMRLWKRRDAIFGVAGAPALDVQIVQARITADADVMTLLAPYRQLVF